jgi:hypothetical protein
MERPRWHALLVRPRLERCVTSRLKNIGVEFYLPMLRVSRKWSGNVRSIELPLFPGYVMCKCAVPAWMWTVPGVISMIRGTYDRRDTADRDIADLRCILDSGLRVRRWPLPLLAGGESVIVDDGPLRGISGVLRKHENEWLFIFSIQLIQESVALSPDSLRLISLRRTVSLQ